MKEWVVRTTELRRFRVDWIVKADTSEMARRVVDEGFVDHIVDENAQLDSTYDQEILSVEENV